MRTNIPDVFSAGDVTSFPLAIRGDLRVNIGHWQMSQAQGKRLKDTHSFILIFLQHKSFFKIQSRTCYGWEWFETSVYPHHVGFLLSGRVAALNMLKKPTEFESVPFFWTVLAGKSIRYTGGVFSLEKVTHTLEYLKSHFPLSFPHSRLWGRVHRNHIQRKSRGKEVPGVLHKVSTVDKLLIQLNMNFCYLCWISLISPFVNRDDKVVAAASLMFDPAVAHVAELMTAGQILTKAQAQWVSCCIHTN